MQSQEKYSVKWHSYSDHLRSMMKELMMNEDFSDVTLVTEDKKRIKANMNVLSSSSPVFKDILKKEKQSSQIIFLRGIQYSEMESIIQFIYLGEATLYEDRTNEFLSIAKLLEITALCQTETETNDELDDEALPLDINVSDEEVQITKKSTQESRGDVSVRKYECKQCHKSYSSSGALSNHRRSAHLGVQYECDQCDFQASRQDTLVVHIQSKHEGIQHTCDQCDYHSTYRTDLLRHIKAKHEGIKYPCDQCDYQANYQRNLRKHIASNHL